MPRQSYLQIHVPLDHNSPWFRDLRTALSTITNRWQNSFHITVAFIEDELETDKARKVAALLKGILSGAGPLDVTFDKLDAFSNRPGTQHIVNLTASSDQPALTALVDKVRTKLSEQGYHLGPYKLHVTLTRINVPVIDLKSLQAIIDKVQIQPFTLSLYKADYRFRGERTRTIAKWDWTPAPPPDPEKIKERLRGEIGYYFERDFFRHDLPWFFKVLRKDGFRFVREMNPDWEEREPFRFTGRQQLYRFFGIVCHLLIAEQAIRDVGGEKLLHDFLRISRWPLFVLPDDYTLGEPPVFRNMPEWGPGLMMDSVRSEHDVLPGVIRSEMEKTLYCGIDRDFRYFPHRLTASMWKAHRVLMDTPIEVKQAILEKYDEYVSHFKH